MQKEQAETEQKEKEGFKFEEGIKSSDEDNDSSAAVPEHASNSAEPNSATGEPQDLKLEKMELYDDVRERDRI